MPEQKKDSAFDTWDAVRHEIEQGDLSRVVLLAKTDTFSEYTLPAGHVFLRVTSDFENGDAAWMAGGILRTWPIPATVLETLQTAIPKEKRELMIAVHQFQAARSGQELAARERLQSALENYSGELLYEKYQFIHDDKPSKEFPPGTARVGYGLRLVYVWTTKGWVQHDRDHPKSMPTDRKWVSSRIKALCRRIIDEGFSNIRVHTKSSPIEGALSIAKGRRETRWWASFGTTQDDISKGSEDADLNWFLQSWCGLGEPILGAIERSQEEDEARINARGTAAPVATATNTTDAHKMTVEDVRHAVQVLAERQPEKINTVMVVDTGTTEAKMLNLDGFMGELIGPKAVKAFYYGLAETISEEVVVGELVEFAERRGFPGEPVREFLSTPAAKAVINIILAGVTEKVFGGVGQLRPLADAFEERGLGGGSSILQRWAFRLVKKGIKSVTGKVVKGKDLAAVMKAMPSLASPVATETPTIGVRAAEPAKATGR